MNPPPQRPPHVAEGERLGPYLIESHLADGGVGQVYRARDTRRGRAVAIKIADHEFGDRCEREVRAISNLNHPHICTVYDVGPNYFVMELVQGDTLAARIARLGAAGIPVADILGWGEEIADALAEAHSKDITHRDLKPGNVMIAKSGVKVLGFGLAKWTTEQEIVGPDSVTRSLGQQLAALTVPGSTVGTVAYMSPEQARGEPMDSRTDIFSLGVVLYEMATGVRPFGGSSHVEIFAGILKGAPAPPSSLNPAVSPELSRIILRALEKDRELRFQSAADLRSELMRLTHVSAQSASQTSPPSGAAPLRRRLGQYAVAAVALAAICRGGYLLSRSRPSEAFLGFLQL